MRRTVDAIGFQPEAGAFETRLAAAVAAMGKVKETRPAYRGMVFLHDTRCTFGDDPMDRCICSPWLIRMTESTC